MAEVHTILNALSPAEAEAALARCCGSARWVKGMMGRRPFASAAAVHAAADVVWNGLGLEDVLEAFAQHPRIGRRTTPTSGSAWSDAEQARIAEASAEILRTLHRANEAYVARFGYIFIVCATGKSAPEMLALLERRLRNDPVTELGVAAAEQAKITHLRLEKLTS
jgi:OHCU decarboxylase